MLPHGTHPGADAANRSAVRRMSEQVNSMIAPSSLFTADDFEWTATPRKLLLRIAAAARRKKPCHHAGQPRFSELLAVRAAHLEEGHQALHLHLRSTTRSVQHR